MLCSIYNPHSPAEVTIILNYVCFFPLVLCMVLPKNYVSLSLCLCFCFACFDIYANWFLHIFFCNLLFKLRDSFMLLHSCSSYTVTLVLHSIVFYISILLLEMCLFPVSCMTIVAQLQTYFFSRGWGRLAPS